MKVLTSHRWKCPQARNLLTESSAQSDPAASLDGIGAFSFPLESSKKEKTAWQLTMGRLLLCPREEQTSLWISMLSADGPSPCSPVILILWERCGLIPTLGEALFSSRTVAPYSDLPWSVLPSFHCVHWVPDCRQEQSGSKYGRSSYLTMVQVGACRDDATG